MTHEPECNNTFAAYLGCSVCDRLRAAYQRGYTAGYNDHARTIQHWQDTHGAYRAAPVVTHQCPPEGVYLMPCCNISPLERLADRMTLDPALVTCTGRRS